MKTLLLTLSVLFLAGCAEPSAKPKAPKDPNAIYPVVKEHVANNVRIFP
jgi:hypothetical protein